MSLQRTTILSLCCTGLIGLGLVSTALEMSALPIDGSLYLAFSATPDDANLLNTTRIDFDDAFTIGTSGSFAGVPSLTQVSMNSLLLDPFTRVNRLWSFSAGGQDYWFDLTSLSVGNRTSSALYLSGTGLLSSGTEQAIANWSLGMNSRGQGVSVTFSTDEPQNVPDGGNTALLCLLAFACLAPLKLNQARCKEVA